MARSRQSVAELLASPTPRSGIRLSGWVRTRRDAKSFSFIEVNDGSCLANIQAIADAELEGYATIKMISTGAAVSLEGDLVESPGKGQKWEVRITRFTLIGACADDYPLQKKRHSDEYLRTIAHLRGRTNKYGAMFRIRSRLSFAVHQFFQDRGFHHIHTPIITGADCEGAGEMFRVTTFDLPDVPKKDGAVDFSEDFFGTEAHLTVSGQLAIEPYALALGKVYTFGPTFRSENSNTSRHMSEFWMIEPEFAFADLADDMDLAEEMVRYLIAFVRADCAEDMALFARFVEPDLLARLDLVERSDFVRLPYGEAIEILAQSGEAFEFTPAWGSDLQSEHERYLTETHFKQPVFVYDWPSAIKAFYMRENDDGKTVAAMDLLVPHIGELIGGSQREERFEVLQRRLDTESLKHDDYWWYLETRRFGSAPHAGFGLGFERFLMFVTGVGNIRDVIPYPRTPKHLEF
ncbi:MAG: asparagine--tRNA ligase [Proteobacteria bacterium]|nr:MAG: asparagine--tRNA ligase [Pseudomonadota bacterium]